jgi:hypothetical protein
MTSVRVQAKAYHIERINDNGINMRTSRLVRDFCHIMHNIGSQPQFCYAIYDSGAIVKGIDKQDASVRKRRHLREGLFHRQLTELRGDREEELASFRDLTLDPHVTGHEVDESFRDG